MIKSNELRIGNLVVDGKGRICRVTEINGEESKYTNGFMAWPMDGGWITTTPHKAIKITEQWLLYFGFEFMSSRQGQTYYHINGWTVLYTYGSWYYSTSKSITIGLKLQFVHQLQNLYYALTGEELTLKKNMDI